MKTFDKFMDWYKSINNVHAITNEIYDKIELKFKPK